MIFPDSVTIFEMVEDADECGVDGHGKPKTCPIQIWEGKGMFQDKEPSETTISSGNIPQGDYNLYLPLNKRLTVPEGHPFYDEEDEDAQLPLHSLLTSSCKVQVNGEAEYYQVIGEPQKRRIIGYIKVVLKLEG